MIDLQISKPAYNRSMKKYGCDANWCAEIDGHRLRAYGYGDTKQLAIQACKADAEAAEARHTQAVLAERAREPERLMLTENLSKIAAEAGYKLREILYSERWGAPKWIVDFEPIEDGFTLRWFSKYGTVHADVPLGSSVPLEEWKQQLIYLLSVTKDSIRLEDAVNAIQSEYKTKYPLRKITADDVGMAIYDVKGYGGILTKFTPGYSNCHLDKPYYYNKTTRLSKEEATQDWRVFPPDELEELTARYKAAHNAFEEFNALHNKTSYTLHVVKESEQ